MALSDHAARDAQRSALIHREIVQIGVLIGLAVIVFVVTREVAANNHDMSLRDAAEWYGRGQQRLEAGQVDDAIDAFRRATVKNRTEKRYGLALARALALNHHDEEARNGLLTLRESAPEDPDVNLALARLASQRQDVTEAIRFYHSALYAPWPTEQGDARRRVRIELIRLLMTHHQISRALAELAAVSADLPDTVTGRLEVAGLFADAGDDDQALGQFQAALRLTPDDGRALAGAGRAAFQLGKYPLANGYLRRAAAEPDVADLREIVDLVLSRDPLASRIGSVERRQRVLTNVSYVQQRLAACLEGPQDRQASDEDLAMAREVATLQLGLKKAAALDADTIEIGVDLTDRAARLLSKRCGPATPLDRALVLIGRQHPTDAR